MTDDRSRYVIEEHPEHRWPWWVAHRAGRYCIGRFDSEEGARLWVGYLERADAARGAQA